MQSRFILLGTGRKHTKHSLKNGPSLVVRGNLTFSKWRRKPLLETLSKCGPRIKDLQTEWKPLFMSPMRMKDLNNYTSLMIHGRRLLLNWWSFTTFTTQMTHWDFTFS